MKKEIKYENFSLQYLEEEFEVNKKGNFVFLIGFKYPKNLIDTLGFNLQEWNLAYVEVSKNKNGEMQMEILDYEEGDGELKGIFLNLESFKETKKDDTYNYIKKIKEICSIYKKYAYKNNINKKFDLVRKEKNKLHFYEFLENDFEIIYSVDKKEVGIYSIVDDEGVLFYLMKDRFVSEEEKNAILKNKSVKLKYMFLKEGE